MSEFALLPYQCAAISDKTGVVVIEKSRRIGMTFALAAHCVTVASVGREDCWYTAYNESQGIEFIRDCEKWCRWLGIAADGVAGEIVLQQHAENDGKLIGVKAFGITFPSGKRIVAITSQPRNLRGKQGVVILDEVAFVDDLAELMKAAISLRIWGSQVFICSTHNGADNPFAVMCDDVRDGKLPYSIHRVSIGTALEQGLYQRICMVTKREWSEAAQTAWLAELEREYGDGAAEELHCEPAKAGTSYIGRALVDACMYDAPVVRYELEDDAMSLSEEQRTADMREWLEASLGPLCVALPDQAHALGFDFGRYSDLSVCVPLTIGQDLVKRAPFMIELRNVPFNQQWQLVEWLHDHLPRFTHSCFDAGGNGSWVAEQAWIHFGGDDYVERIQLSQKWYAEHMPAFKMAHENKTLRYPRDMDVRADVCLVRRINGIPMLPKLKNEGVVSKGKRHGDAAIALALAYSAAVKGEELMLRWDRLAAV